MKCTSCGHEFENAKFCPECGKSTQPDVSQTSGDSSGNTQENAAIKTGNAMVKHSKSIGIIVAIILFTVPFFAFKSCTDTPPATDDNDNHITLISHAEVILEDVTGKNVKISTKEEDWIVEVNGLTVFTNSRVEIDGERVRAKVEYTFTDETKENFRANYVEVDGEALIKITY